MKRLIALAVGILVFAFIAGGTVAYAQGTFKIPFKFEAGGKKLPSGEYWVAQNGDGQLTLRQESTGKEFQIPFVKRLAQPTPPVEAPQLVFDMVGNFEPSYTEYMTDYVLAEVWLVGEEGFLVHTTKGAHQHKTIKGQIAKK
ncbi:MAG: hypothetical protein NTV82_14970 [Candidatus Aminicenantes bacterium]|nr:hypothetical protein [Candidatus Aminicenantes bacterium]